MNFPIQDFTLTYINKGFCYEVKLLKNDNALFSLQNNEKPR